MPDNVAQRFIDREGDASALLVLKAKDRGKLRDGTPYYRQKKRIARHPHAKRQLSPRRRGRQALRVTPLVAAHSSSDCQPAAADIIPNLSHSVSLSLCRGPYRPEVGPFGLPWDTAPPYLLHDRYSIYGGPFSPASARGLVHEKS